MRTRSILLTLLVLTLAIASCGGPGSPPPPDDDTLKTVVAGTLEAISTREGKDLSPDAPQPSSGVSTQSPSDTTPPVTPAVLRIVYTHDGNAWLIEGTSPPSQLTSSGGIDDVLISNDGMKIAYIYRATPDAQSEIHSINIDGTGDTTLLTPAQLDALYPLGPFLHHDISSIAFVPGTHNLMFNTRGIAEGPGLAKHRDLLLLDTDTGVMTTLFAPGSGGDFTLAPDGSQLALITPSWVSLVNTDGTNLRPKLITYLPVSTYSEFAYYAQPVWTPDSDALGVAFPSADPLAPSTEGSLWRIPAHGGSPINTATIAGGFYFPQVFGAPLITRNLQRVAFLRETSTANIYDLYLANFDGSGESIYATGKIQWMGWAPDSQHFVYSLGGPMDLYLGEDGGPSTPIGSCIDLRWIDQTQYLCLSGSLGAWTLMRGQIGGSFSPIVNPIGDFISYDFDQ